MEVFRSELHASLFRGYIDATREAIGEAGLQELLAPYGVTASDFSDPRAWLSLEFVDSFLGAMCKRCPDPNHFEKAARLSMSPRYIGPMLPLFQAFGTPLFAYRQACRAGGRMNHLGVWEAELAKPGRVRMVWRGNPGVLKTTSEYVCRATITQFALIPALFDRSEAKVEHTQCTLRGDVRCAYEIAWDEPLPRADAAIGFALAGLSAAALAVPALGFGWRAYSLMTLAAVGGWALGRMRILRAFLNARMQETTAQNDALAEVTGVNAARYAELLEAKAEVEQKVDLRTRELRAASEQLALALSKLQALDRAKTDFFHNVSHELRSPLTLILAPLEELMAGRRPPGGEAEALKTMHRNTARLLRLINQLLDLSRIDAGQMRLDVQPTDVLALVRGAVHGFAASAERRGVRIEELAPQNVEPISIDATLIDSALTNLLANALRFAPAHSVVQVRVSDHADTLSITVADQGPGISALDREKVFERFAQADNTSVGGSGIGLALVREAARLHGGDAELQSELGQGASFTLRLPRRAALMSTPSVSAAQAAQPALPHASVALIDEPYAVSGGSERPGPHAGAPLALVVEDNPELSALVCDVLSAHYRVRAAADGVEGLALALELRPAVVISDVAMPNKDGYELCTALRAHEPTRSTPILLLTARTDLEGVLHGFDVGANDYLLKPFHAPELLARVDVHVRLQRTLAQLARRERLAAIGSLAASVAHNVRNPLSALISGLPALRERMGQGLDRASSELVAVMLECSERIERMTFDLLELSRIDRAETGDFAPGTGLLACVRTLAERTAERVTLRIDVDDTTMLVGRAGDMNHAFMNLLDNALRAVESGGVVEVSARRDATDYLVTISDSGSGIAPEHLAHVFEPFWTTRSAGEGSGLGLSVARQIVEEHGGQLHAGRSALGGAQLSLRLPLSAVLDHGANRLAAVHQVEGLVDA